jgi:hypothetical protein
MTFLIVLHIADLPTRFFVPKEITRATLTGELEAPQELLRFFLKSSYLVKARLAFWYFIDALIIIACVVKMTKAISAYFKVNAAISVMSLIISSVSYNLSASLIMQPIFFQIVELSNSKKQ